MKCSIYIVILRFWDIVILGFFLVACSTGQKGEDHSAHTAPVGKPSCTDNALMLTDTQLRLANITTQKVSMKPVGQTQLLNAVLAVDEENSQVISTQDFRQSGKIVF